MKRTERDLRYLRLFFREGEVNRKNAYIARSVANPVAGS